MKERMKLPVSAQLFLIEDHKILLLRRYNTGYEDGRYSVVAGHIDGNETVAEAMIREAKEEADILIAREDLKTVHVMHRKKVRGEYIDYFFFCNKWSGNIRNSEPHKCDDLRWFDINNLPDNMVDYVKEAISYYKNGINFSEFGW